MKVSEIHATALNIASFLEKKYDIDIVEIDIRCYECASGFYGIAYFMDDIQGFFKYRIADHNYCLL